MFRMPIRKRNSDSLNRSTISEHVSWNRCFVSKRLKTDVFISAKLFEMRSVSSAYHQKDRHTTRSETVEDGAIIKRTARKRNHGAYYQLQLSPDPTS